jgi:hypothetical protein
MRTLAVLLAVVGAYRARQNGLGLASIKGVMRSIVQGSVASLAQLGAVVKKQMTV